MKEQAGRAGRVTPTQPSGEFNFVQVFSATKHFPIADPPTLGRTRTTPHARLWVSSELTEMCGDGFSRGREEGGLQFGQGC